MEVRKLKDKLTTMHTTDELLDEYEKEIIQHPNQLRNYVTNRLLEYSGNDDPKVRIRALELLGKTIGIFTDVVEQREERASEVIAEEIEEKIIRLLEESQND
mgnify:CR=1 FL=1